MSRPPCDPQDPCNSGRCPRCNTDDWPRARIVIDPDGLARPERLCVGCFEPVGDPHSPGCPTGQNGPPRYD